jgi:hypothetical protein
MRTRLITLSAEDDRNAVGLDTFAPVLEVGVFAKDVRRSTSV